MKILARIAPLVLLTALGANAAEPTYDVIPDSGAGTEAFLKQRFPLDTPLQQVVDYLETQTFDCRRAKDPVFGEKDETLAGNFVFCDRIVAYGFQVGKRWRVAIVEDQRKVKDFRASFAVVGR